MMRRLSYHEDAAAAPETAPPARLGRYELVGHLATGGMAEIHLARLAGEAGFEKTVVVKRLLPELVASKAFVTMFLDEGRLAARLSHPNVCDVFELGRDGNEYFLVMPYLDGVPATDFIARPRESDRIAQLRVAAGIVTQACAGLHHAHEAKGPDGAPLGLVHRDISPSNLFVTADGVTKVLDFGIAKVRGAAETEAGTIKGKTQYMAPEQLLGESLDRRADLFALGIVLFELTTHQRLFKRASDFLTAKAILEEPIPRADATDPAVPVPIADVIAKALSRTPADRYQTARELGAALDAAFAAHGGVARADQIAAALADWHGTELSAMRTRQAQVLAAATSVTGATTMPAAAVAGPQRRRGWLLGVLAAALVGGGLYVAQRRTVSTPTPTPTPMPTQVAAEPVVDAAVATPTTSVDAAVAAPLAAPGPTADAAVAMPEPQPHRQPLLARDPGFVSIDSTPFATIYVDGTKLGITPLVKKQLPAGKHKVRAVLDDGRARTIDVDVRPGKLAKPLVLTW